MSQPKIQVLGAYKVEPTDDLLKEAFKLKCYGMQLTESERAEVERIVREELSSVVLLDILVTNADERFDIGVFGQPDSDQAPYDEAYLSIDGTTVISRFEPPPGDSFRVAFFLHFFDPTKPLATPYGEVPIPAIQPMPKHFQELMPYAPVD